MNAIYTINLQLFAGNLNVQTTTTGTVNADPSVWGGTGLTAEMKTFYDMTLIDEASAQLVHDQFGQKRPIPANGGKTIEFRKFDNLPDAMTPLTEGVTPDGNKLDVSTIEATVDQYGDYIVQSDVLELTAVDNTIVEATKILGKQAGSTLDSVVRLVLAAGTNVLFSGGKSKRGDLTAADTLSVQDVKKAVAILRANNAPTINGDYVAIIHPYAAYDLMSDEKWVEAHKYAKPENLYTGEIGKIAGVRFVETSNATVYEGAAGNVFGTIILGEGAYGVTEITGGGLQTIVKQKGSAGTGDPLDQRSSVGWKALKTAERLVENYMIRIESIGEFSANVTPNA